MMPSRSTPNLRENKTTSVYSYLQNQSGLNFAPVSTAPPTRDEDSPPPAPPVRDSSSLKSIKYGPGHEKFPSWPVPAAADTPQALRSQTSGGGSHRSKSWTDHTNYPKEKVVIYTRPYMKRQHSQYTQQKLKTVMERCEKIPPETFESRYDKMNERLYLPHVDHDGKSLGDADYMVPSPPERDIANKPQLTQADLEEYARSYQEPKFCEGNIKPNHGHLTESGLEEFMEYTRNYEDSLFNSMNSKHEEGMLTHLHQKQVSYAQSEGYHSYVSSTDSTSTPFLDRLRRDSEAVVSRPLSSNTWDEMGQEEGNSRREGRDSVVTTSSGSASSSETLKWHGSMSDVSVTSHSSSHLANNSSTRQLIAHSARVQTPQRHHSESVLYMSGEKEGSGAWKDRESRNNNANKLKLFPVNTYTVQENEGHGGGGGNVPNNRLSVSLQSALSVADRISELEKQQKYSYLDPDKKHKIPDPTLKAIQKKALLSFYERHHNNPTNKTAWRSEPHLAQSQQLSVPQPPSKVKVQMPSRRASSASDYASGCNSKRSSLASNLESKTTDNISKTLPRHQHSNSCGSLATELLGPVIMGPSISVDDWVPEKPPARPPKNPHLRTAFPDLFQDQRVPSPDLPPPSPPTVVDDEVFNSDEPLPPPPPECETEWQEFNDRFKETTTGHQLPAPQVQKAVAKKEVKVIQQTVGIPERNLRYSSVRSSIKTKPGEQIFHQVSSKPYVSTVQAEKSSKPEQILGFPNQRGYQERSSTRYPSTQKLVLNGNIAVSQKVSVSDQYKPEPLRPPNREEMKKQPVSLPPDTHRAQRASIAVSPIKDVPPPLQPRQMRVNQSMRVRMPHDHRPGATSRSSPMKEGMRETRSASLSQSKASYLAPRRDRDRIVPDSETGSYKRTMSPNGHALTPEVINDSQRVNSREAIWPLNRGNKEAIKNNNNLLRRASMNDKQKKDKCDEKEDLKPNLALPDVLPVNVKLLGPRSQQYNRPTHLSLSPLDNNGVMKMSPMKTPPSSPSRTPPRGSPFTPLRTTNLSSPPLISTTVSSPIIRTSSVTSTPSFTTVNSSIATTPPVTSTPHLRYSPGMVTATSCTKTTPTPMVFNSTSRISPSSIPSTTDLKTPSETPPQSPLRSSPPIKPSLSPCSPMKISPMRSSPNSNSSNTTNTSTPLHISPLSSPLASPQSPTTPEFPSPLSIHKTDDYPKVIEGLQLIQRTEVVLRVNTTTTDAASQTEKEELPPTPLPTRKKLQEEIECEKLAEDFVDHLPTSDRLKELLVPVPEHKKPTDYVQGLFRVDVTSRPRPASSPFRSRNNTPSSTPPPTLTSLPTISTSKLSLSPTVPVVPIIEPTSPLSGSSIYFTTSEPKAKFLTRYSQDMNKCHIVKDTKDLSQKKEELVNRLDKKLEVLRGEQVVVTDECKINDELGENVETHINRVARPHEVAKFRLHVEEVGKITSLLLGLSGRLARAENALMCMADDHPERTILEAKRDKLLDQLEEAKKLKECIDRRSVSVSNILYKYLNSEEYADYDHFINMKAKLIMDSKEISDKIKLGEEQLLALKETIIVTD